MAFNNRYKRGGGSSYNQRPSSYNDRRSSFSDRGSDRGSNYSDRGNSDSRKPYDDNFGRNWEDKSADYNTDMIEPAPMPGEWEPTDKDMVPSWDKELLPEEERPADWTPPTPPPVEKTLLPYTEEFEKEDPLPPRVQEMDKEKILRNSMDLPDNEPLVLFNNGCIISTTLKGIIQSKENREREDRDFEGGRGGGRGRGGFRGGRGRGRGVRDDRGGESGDPNMVPVSGKRKNWGGR